MSGDTREHTTRYKSVRQTAKCWIRGFTLIELLVALVIASILTTLSLAGMAGARHRSKVDKTKSTIRKIHEILIPQYDSYVSRRVTVTPGTDRRVMAKERLYKVRALIAQELPDVWADVGATVTPPPVPRTPPMLRYAAYKPTSNLSTGAYQTAECLYMTVTCSGFNPEAVELFRADEIIDINSNKALEFGDGWGRPIAFIRWPAGYDKSPIQNLDGLQDPDPLDPMQVSGSLNNPDPSLIPLIFSPGPDESTNDPQGSLAGYGLYFKQTPWITADYATALLTTKQGTPLAGTPDSTTQAYRDNISNHDFLKR